ncbi:MAG: tRNA preQ1(34) S-adenosylmethionine ribosyltransferase-isomerase QueA [Acidobacteriota bacterium]|nr:MAG: tRNA preQ1(34) S-adenosylmethionine ribosyltransferase-isomerase QueA [Acidobacteriota bacterium]
MHISEFNYELPPELIAQQPLAERDASRMLVLDRRSGRYRDDLFMEFPNYLDQGDCIVINNTRVFPARLTGRRLHADRTTGAAVEALLVRQLSDEVSSGSIKTIEWEALAKPGRALPVGAEIVFGANGEDTLRAAVTGILEEGRRRLRFEYRGDFNRIVDAIGQPPLPPYIKRPEGSMSDATRYQTVYASRRGAIAAPTAGLHFTPRIFDALRHREIEIVEITHHVGYATFQPVRVETIEEHHIEPEAYEIDRDAARRINAARLDGRRILAVGTTCVRALESAADTDGSIRPERASTRLFIYPGYTFRAVNALLTNFHLPKSSLLMLVSAFAGRDHTLQAYRHAVSEKYRFFSYGDCMLTGDWECR